MTYTCFPNQTPFPLPPGVTTPPSSPSFTDNGPQLPANSVDIWWTLALIGEPGSSADWSEAEISADVPVADWLSALIATDSYPSDLDLCQLVGLLDFLPDDETFVPEEEDADTPILPPYQETFYVEAAVRLTGFWFFIPGPVRLEQGSASAIVRAKCIFGAPVGDSIHCNLEVLEQGLYTKVLAATAIRSSLEPSFQGSIRLVCSMDRTYTLTAGVVFGMTVSKP